MSTASRIKALREAARMSQAELARRVGYTSRSSIAKVEKGLVDLSESKIKQFAEVLGTTPADLLELTEPDVTGDFVTFGILGEIGAGYERFAEYEDYTNGSIDVPASWLRGRPKTDYFVLRVSGESMFPTYQDGDLVLVLRQTTMNYSGQIGAVVYDDNKATLKRVEYVMGEDWMRLVPVNPNYPPIMVTDERLEHCRVLGIPKYLVRRING